MFRKDVYPDPEDWNDATFWHPDIRSKSRLPCELACHAEVSARRGTVFYRHGIVPLREIASLKQLVDENSKRYRVYTHYCQHGSLQDVLEFYQEYGDPIPEPFIWYVAERLMEAGLALASTGLGEIVHR